MVLLPEPYRPEAVLLVELEQQGVEQVASQQLGHLWISVSPAKCYDAPCGHLAWLRPAARSGALL